MLKTKFVICKKRCISDILQPCQLHSREWPWPGWPTVWCNKPTRSVTLGLLGFVYAWLAAQPMPTVLQLKHWHSLLQNKSPGPRHPDFFIQRVYHGRWIISMPTPFLLYTTGVTTGESQFCKKCFLVCQSSTLYVNHLFVSIINFDIVPARIHTTDYILIALFFCNNFFSEKKTKDYSWSHYFFVTIYFGIENKRLFQPRLVLYRRHTLYPLFSIVPLQSSSSQSILSQLFSLCYW